MSWPFRIIFCPLVHFLLWISPTPHGSVMVTPSKFLHPTPHWKRIWQEDNVRVAEAVRKAPGSKEPLFWLGSHYRKGLMVQRRRIRRDAAQTLHIFPHWISCETQKERDAMCWIVRCWEHGAMPTLNSLSLAKDKREASSASQILRRISLVSVPTAHWTFSHFQKIHAIYYAEGLNSV